MKIANDLLKTPSQSQNAYYEVYRGDESEYDTDDANFNSDDNSINFKFALTNAEDQIKYQLSAAMTEKPFAYLHIEYVLFISMVLSTITALVSVSSWVLIPKWRSFRNHVFMMIVTTFAALHCVLEASRTLGKKYWIEETVNFLLCACAWWLLVASVMFYMDLVKVFKSSITRRMLKSNLLVWGVATMTTVASVVDHALWGGLRPFIEYDVMLLIPLIINCVIYVIVLRSLLHGGTQSVRVKTQAATFTLLMSGAVMLAAVVAAEPNAWPVLYALAQLIFAVQTITIDVCFLMLKSNRQAWKEYYKNLKVSLSDSE